MTDQTEAMRIWREACEVSQETWCSIGEQPNDPEGIAQGKIADKAAAQVIADALAERDARIAQLEAIVRRSGEGWGNVLELGLIPVRHCTTAQTLADECRKALEQPHDPS